MNFFSFAVIFLPSSLFFLPSTEVECISLGGISMLEVQRLLARVDPPTCGCKTGEECEISIPGARFIGFRCNNPQTKFCCRRKKGGFEAKEKKTDGKPTSHDLEDMLSQKSEVLKALLVGNKASKVVVKPVAAPLNDQQEDEKGDEKTDETTNNVAENAKEPEEAESASVSAAAAPCPCRDSSECPAERVDYSFGSSCGFGFVKCCTKAPATASASEDDQMVVTEDEADDEEEENPTIKLLFPLVPPENGQTSTAEEEFPPAEEIENRNEEAEEEESKTVVGRTRNSATTTTSASSPNKTGGLTKEQYGLYVRLMQARMRQQQRDYENSFLGRMNAALNSASEFLNWLFYGNSSSQSMQQQQQQQGQIRKV